MPDPTTVAIIGTLLAAVWALVSIVVGFFLDEDEFAGLAIAGVIIIGIATAIIYDVLTPVVVEVVK